MHSKLSYRLFALVAIISATISCGRDDLIPKDKMVEILSEMFLTDQYARENIHRQKMADTSYVYRPIIESFGYTEDDFRRSVNKYIEDPADFGAVFGAVAKNLRGRKKDVDIQEMDANKLDSLSKAITSMPVMNPDTADVLSFFFRSMRDTTQTDSSKLARKIVPVEEENVEKVPEDVEEEVIEDVIEEAFE